MQKWTKSLVTGLTLAVITACAPNEKSEMKQWAYNSKRLTELAQVYPGFKGAVDQGLGASTKAWEEAQKEADQKVRAEKMSAANDLAMAVIYPVTGYEAKVKDLKEAIKDRRLNNLPAGKVVPMVRQAYDAIERADRMVKGAKAATPEELKTVMNQAKDALNKAERPLKQLIASAKKK